MMNRFHVCRALDRALGRPLPAAGRLLGKSSFGVMVRQEFGLGFPYLRKPVFHDTGNPVVNKAAAALQQRLVCGIADEGVLEDILGALRVPAPVDQFRLDQAGKRLVERRFVHRRHSPDQVVGEFAPQGGADLGNLPRARKPIKPRHQRILQSRRNCRLQQRSGQPVIPRLLAEHARLDDHFEELLDKQRHAVRLRHDVPDDLGRQRLAVQPPRYQLLGMQLADADQRQPADVRSSGPGPGRREIRPGDQQQQHA